MADTPQAQNGELPERLESWKEIASFFNKDITTVQRWEKQEGLPVHRHLHGKRGTVHAYRAELAAWWAARHAQLENGRPAVSAVSYFRVIAAGAVLLALTVAVWRVLGARDARSSAPPADQPPQQIGRILARTAQRGGPHRIPVGRGPGALVLTPDGAELYVGNYWGSSVSIVDTRQRRVKHTLPVGEKPMALAMAPDGSTAYVASWGGSISSIDTRTKAVARLELGGPVHGFALTPDGARLYVAMLQSGLKRIELPGNRVVQLPTTACPAAVAVAPRGDRLYVDYQCGGPRGRSGHDSIDVLELPSERWLSTISGLPNVGTRIVTSPRGDQVWLTTGNACSGADYDHEGCPSVPSAAVHALRTADHSLLRSFAFEPESSADGVWFLPDGGRALVLGRGMLRVLDTRSFATLEALPLTVGASAALSPSGDVIYAPLSAEDAVGVFETEPCASLPQSGLVSEWRGDGVATDAKAGRHATPQGPIAFAAGRIGQAFLLNGRDVFLEVRDLGHPWIAGRFTASAFVRFESLSAPGRASTASSEMAILDHRTESANWRLLKGGDDRIHAIADGDKPVRLSSSTSVVPARWYHVALVHDAGQLSLYVDGEREAHAAITVPAGGMANLFLGALAGRSAFLHGALDEVGFYERALTSAEIRRMSADFP